MESHKNKYVEKEMPLLLIVRIVAHGTDMADKILRRVYNLGCPAHDFDNEGWCRYGCGVDAESHDLPCVTVEGFGGENG